MPRAAGKEKPGCDINVSVDIDIDKEIIEEYKEKDIWPGGIPGLLSERRTAITRAMVLELDENFFLVGVGSAKKVMVLLERYPAARRLQFPARPSKTVLQQL